MNSKTLLISFGTLVAVVAIGGVLATMYKSTLTSIAYFACIILTVIGMFLVHKRTSHYICSDCDHMFVVKFTDDLFCATGKEGKYLKCPKCGKKGFFREMEYREE